MAVKTRLQVTVNKNDKINAEEYTKSNFGLTLNQYLNMQITQMSKHYINEDEVTDEVQKEIDDAVAGKTKGKVYESADALLNDLNLLG